MGASDLPLLRTREVIRVFEAAGFTVAKGRGKGSHTVMTKPGVRRPLTIPQGTVKRHLLAAQIKDADLTIEEFLILHRNL